MESHRVIVYHVIKDGKEGILDFDTSFGPRLPLVSIDHEVDDELHRYRFAKHICEKNDMELRVIQYSEQTDVTENFRKLDTDLQ